MAGAWLARWSNALNIGGRHAKEVVVGDVAFVASGNRWFGLCWCAGQRRHPDQRGRFRLPHHGRGTALPEVLPAELIPRANSLNHDPRSMGLRGSFASGQKEKGGQARLLTREKSYFVGFGDAACRRKSAPVPLSLTSPEDLGHTAEACGEGPFRMMERAGGGQYPPAAIGGQ